MTIFGFGRCRLRGAPDDSSSEELLGSESLKTGAFLRRVLGAGDGSLLATLLGAAETIFGFSSFPLGRNFEDTLSLPSSLSSSEEL